MRLDPAEADETACQRDHCFVDVGPSGVQWCAVTTGMKPGECSLNRPAPVSQTRAVPGPPAGKVRHDSAIAECSAVTLRVMRAVGADRIGAEPAIVADGHDAVDELGELGHVVAISRRERDRRWSAFPGYDQMVLGADTAALTSSERFMLWGAGQEWSSPSSGLT